MERKNRQNTLILQNEVLQTELEQVTSKNRVLEEQLSKEKNRLQHELEEKKEIVREMQYLKGELAALNDKLNALQVKNSGAFGKCVYLFKLLSTLFSATFARQLISL
ncbi:unnamed protein product [Oikopleura dioica]|uniref:Uncharacterized protein n=1 Tax=Oikopleura dioica TaxID=34765 RepID=E4YUY2_OIKDI|nr:unnamed protein product [Oikopleura dioica]